MSNKNNQIRNKMIASYPKTDRQKLAGLEKYIHKKYPDAFVVLEPFVKFTKGEDECIGVSKTITGDTFKKYNIRTCDLFLIINNRHIFVELDGPIHDIKTEKTEQRNKRYELNDMAYIVINEAELKLKLGVTKLTQQMINDEFEERLQ